MSGNLALAVAAGSGVFAGVILTGVISLVTTVLNRRNEQRRWLMDNRLEAYAAFNLAFTAADQAFHEAEVDALARARQELAARNAQVQTLAPAMVAVKASEVSREALGILTIQAMRSRRSTKLPADTRNDVPAPPLAQGARHRMHLRNSELLGLERQDLQGVRRHQGGRRTSN